MKNYSGISFLCYKLKIQRCVAPLWRSKLLNEIYYFCKIWKQHLQG